MIHFVLHVFGFVHTSKCTRNKISWYLASIYSLSG